eukprot:scaffold253202_cov21-Tisochrysis_lutea.AAC.1
MGDWEGGSYWTGCSVGQDASLEGWPKTHRYRICMSLVASLSFVLLIGGTRSNCPTLTVKSFHNARRLLPSVD